MDIASTIELSEKKLRENNKMQPSVIDRITHDILNQLCIICLGCCELRNSLGAKLDSDQLNEFKRIEGAVQDAATKIQHLKTLLHAHLPTCDDANLSEPALNPTKRADNFQMMPARSSIAEGQYPVISFRLRMSRFSVEAFGVPEFQISPKIYRDLIKS